MVNGASEVSAEKELVRLRDGAQPNKVCDSACTWELALLHF